MDQDRTQNPESGTQNPERRPCRRAVLKTGLGLFAGISLTPASVVAQEDAAALRPREGDLLVKDGDAALKPLIAADIPLNDLPMMAWAIDPATKVVRKGSRLNMVLLVRLDTQTLAPGTAAASADGVVAYSALCPHAGCEVTDFVSERALLACDCHSALFDPKNGGRVIEGPAISPLPALPLKLVDGVLAVAKPFTAAITFE
jgi:Rieske Fe-S protein